MLSLSKYLDMADLQHIQFSSLQSAVEIKNGIIYLPKTSVKNTALNIELWGTHTFNNGVDYHIQLLISDLLSKKRHKKDVQFGPIENDPDNRRSAFILMTGNLDNLLIKYDKRGLKEKIRNDLKQEKQTLKQLLKEEFGLFRKDSTKKVIKNQEQEQGFDLQKQSTKPEKKGEPKKTEEDDEDF
jgi:AsmA-like C-terminal region